MIELSLLLIQFDLYEDGDPEPRTNFLATSNVMVEHFSVFKQLYLIFGEITRIIFVQMIEVLRNHIKSRLGDDLDNLDKVLSSFKHISTKRNEQLLRQGETCKYVYFIAKGCLQVYVYDKDFNETTRDIVVEDNWCSELVSFGSGKPAEENIRTVESCELFAIDRQTFQSMMETVPQFDKVYKQILEASYANSVYRINTFVSLSALDRIKWLMEYRPMLMARLSSKLIASYLGINKDVFSRLKSQL